MAFPKDDLYPRVWHCSNEQYHAASHIVGHSLLDEFREDSRDFHDIYVAKTVPKPEPTKEMQIGTAVHCALLEPERFAAEYRPLPPLASDGEPWNWRKKSHREERDAMGSAMAPDELDLVRRMVDALRGNAFIANALGHKSAEREHTILWRDELTSLACKSRRDLWVPEFGVIIDVKTTAEDVSPRAFAKTVEKYGYHRAAAWYLDGQAAFDGSADYAFVFAVVSRAKCRVALYELRPEDIELGRGQNRRALDSLAACYVTRDWRPVYERQITQLQLSGGAYLENDWEIL